DLQAWRGTAWRNPHTWKTRPREGMTLLAVGLAALLGTGALVGHNQEISRIPATKAKRGGVTVKVTESGELRAQHQVTVSAVNDKQILKLAAEGAYVHAGDTLVVFESEKYV